MSGFARVAVGYWGDRSDPGPICWGLAGCLDQSGVRVRHYLARACYGSPQGVATYTGVASRHLDSWLQSTDDCRAELAEAYASADLVLIEGRYADTTSCGDGSTSDGPANFGGDLATLAHRLDLPQLIVLDAALIADCRLPPRPDAVDGVILDGVYDCDHFVRLQTCVEGAWGVPVVAAVERDEGLRQKLVCLPPVRTVSRDVVDNLVRRMNGYLQIDALRALAHRSTLPQPTATAVLRPVIGWRPTVALAYDDAFCGYFADVLERLEQLGARVVDFSPLADESLPDDADVVLIGCGKPEDFAERLAANYCMRAALRDFARRGGCIYSEGGGTAYLGRTLTMEDGRTCPMVDALPLAAVVQSTPEPWQPIEFTIGRDGRLGPRGSRLRGYRGGRYQLVPLDVCETPAVEYPRDLFSCGNVVGSRMQLHFLAQPALLQSVFERRNPAADAYAGVG